MLGVMAITGPIIFVLYVITGFIDEWVTLVIALMTVGVTAAASMLYVWHVESAAHTTD